VFGLSRLELEACGLALLLAAALVWLGVHDAGVKREALAPVAAAAQAASAAAAVKAAQVDATQKGNLREAQDQIQAQAVQLDGLRAAVADADRLRDAAIRRAAAARAAAAAASGAAGVGADPGMVSADLYAGALTARAEAESDAASAVAAVDGLRTSGGLCTRDYDALR
jgi:hypothetical protein